MSMCLTITEIDWKLTKDVASVLASVAALIGASFAAFIGCRGLSTWKCQLKGGANHDLARRILISVYHYKDAIARTRSPLMFPEEKRPKRRATPSSDYKVEEFEGRKRAYARRFKRVYALS